MDINPKFVDRITGTSSLASNLGTRIEEEKIWSKMGTNSRISAHQLSNGLYVSGRPEQYKDKQPTMSSTAVPYTGGDIKKSGELGKMFDIPVESTSKMKKSGSFQKTPGQGHGTSNSGPLTSGGAPRSAFSASGPINSGGISRQNTGAGNNQGSKSGPLSGNLGRQMSQSGPLNRSGDMAVGPNPKAAPSSGKNSGPQSSAPPIARTNSGNLLPATGLITSGPISSGPLSSSGALKKVTSGPLDSSGAPVKIVSMNQNQAVSNLSNAEEYSFQKGFPKIIFWMVILVFIMGFIAGGFLVATVHNAIFLIIIGSLFSVICFLFTWNICWGKRALLNFLASNRDADLSNARDGQYVKVTGVVTCGSVPLETSYQRVNRCIYSSTGLYEYRGWKAKPARVGHRLFTWGLRYLERHVAEFYISDFQSGLRALVKAGYGAHVTPCVEESTIVDVGPKNKDLPSGFVRWLAERNLSGDDRVMRLKEGHIKEGSTVTVMGVVQRHESVLMIVPPRERVSTGCQLSKFLLPGNVEGLIIACNETTKFDGIPL